MENWLDNKCVIITGASSGMGKGITTRLIKEHNCKVIGIARNKIKMETLIEELGEYSKNFSYQLFDVSKPEKWEAFRDYIKDNNIAPDILINDAGILPRFDKFLNYSMEEINQAMNINFFSCIYSIKAIMPIILTKSESPAVINIDSSAALMSLAGTSIYTASKAALRGLTEAIREEMRGKAYVGLVCPGFTKTDIFRSQSASGSEKALDFVSTSCDKMVNMILNGIRKRKEFMSLGFDGKLMDEFGRLMPVKGGQMFSYVMKKSKFPLFASVFDSESDEEEIDETRLTK